MVDITIVNGVLMVFQPTYNWGAPSCMFMLVISMAVAMKTALQVTGSEGETLRPVDGRVLQPGCFYEVRKADIGPERHML